MFKSVKVKLKIFLRNILSNSIFFSYIGKIIVSFNQKKVLKISRSNKLIFLKPVSPTFGKGGIDNYYHFIFDLLFPLNLLINNSSSDVVFALYYSGINSHRLEELYGSRIKLIEDKRKLNKLQPVKLVGMNPKWVHVSIKYFEQFKNDMCNRLGVNFNNSTPNKIVLIERILQNPPTSIKYSNKIGGSSRRSLVNHDELKNALQAITNSSYEFSNLRMEELTLSEQIQVFDNTVVMIAQHGAALANSLWMKPGSVLIELSNYSVRDHGLRICENRKHNYYLYKTNSDHALIDVNNFIEWLKSFKELRKYFV